MQSTTPPKATPHYRSRSRRPQGQPTRGKTASNRLRRVDILMMKYDPGLIRRSDAPFDHALFVDVGYGATPTTTLESLARLRTLNPNLPILGVEIDPERVAAAQAFVEPGLDFRLGGFNLPLMNSPDFGPEQVRAVRAFNVLRQYEADSVAPAYAAFGRERIAGWSFGGGTSDPLGQLWVAHICRRTAAAAAGGWLAPRSACL